MKAETGVFVVRGTGVSFGGGMATAGAVVTGQSVATLDGVASPAAGIQLPDLFLAAVVERGPAKDQSGTLIEVVRAPWLTLIDHLARNPGALAEMDPRLFESLVAGALRDDGYEDVILTPRSGDEGVDVIALRGGRFPMRMVVQAKRYRPDRRVKAFEVRELLHVLDADRKATSALFTTTSSFAPGVAADRTIAPYLTKPGEPGRLNLMDGSQLADWLNGLAKRTSD
jgi:restriction system protein